MVAVVVGGVFLAVVVAAVAGVGVFVYFANRAIGQSFDRAAERNAATVLEHSGGALGQEGDVRAVESTFASRRWLRVDLLLVSGGLFAFCRTPFGTGQPGMSFVPEPGSGSSTRLDMVTLKLEAAYTDRGRLILIGSNRMVRRKLALEVANANEWHARIRAAGFELAAARFRAPRTLTFMHVWFAGFALLFLAFVATMLLAMFLRASP